MGLHNYRPFTTRDGSEVCADCHAPKSDPIHGPSVEHIEAMANHEDAGVSVGVSRHVLDAIVHLDGLEEFECGHCGIGFFLPSGRCDHCNTAKA